MTQLKRHRTDPISSRKAPKLARELSPASHDAADMDDSEGEDEEPTWGGIAQSDAVTVDTAHKKVSLIDGIQSIKEASELYRSNSFKLQIDALLPNVRPKTSENKTAPLQRFLHHLHSTLQSLSSVAPTHPLTAARQLSKQGVQVPYPLPSPSEDTSWKVSFEKPQDILVVGSWPNSVSVKKKDHGKFSVDLAVEMPNSIFQEKDYLNGRFFHKRAYYLARIASALKEGGLHVGYESQNYDPRLTVLTVQSPSDGSAMDFTKLNAQIAIIPTLSSTSPIPIHKISPSFASIRLTSQDPHPPSPNYNAALLTSTTPRTNLLSVHQLKQDVPAFTDALTLLRIWANQRGYGYGESSVATTVSGFEGKGPFWEMLLSYLVNGEEPLDDAKKGKIKRGVGRGLSSYQLFRAALDFLSKWKPQEERVWVKSKEGHRYATKDYEAFTTVFVDSDSTINLLAGVPMGSIDLLRLDALHTLKALNDSEGDTFTEVFRSDHRSLRTRFDVVLRVNLHSQANSSITHSILDHGSYYLSLIPSISSILRRGLGTRVKAVTILHSHSTTRPINEAHPSTPATIYIGLVYDPPNAFHLVEHGPSVTDAIAQTKTDFTKFWGEDKAELRRFQDGRIQESVVWNVKTQDERFQIPTLIVRHLLKRHFHIGNDDVGVEFMDDMIRLPESVSSRDVPKGFKSAMVAFDELVKAMRAIEDDELPLALNLVTPVCAELRYTSVFAPVALASSTMPPKESFQPCLDIILSFEKSSKWPDDLRAIQIMKLAFMERIANVLMKSIKGCRARVVVGQASDQVEFGIDDRARLEIITREGWAFSAKIAHDREVTLLERAIEAKPKVQLPTMAPKEDIMISHATNALLRYQQMFTHAPAHHRAIAPLHHSHPAYTLTVRLVKRWLASHWLFEGHVAPEAVELLVAYFFMKMEIGSKEKGFAVVISFLAQWKWDEDDGLHIPLSSSTPSSDRHGKGVWRLKTETDTEGRVWTCNKPDLLAARRIRAIAQATWQHLHIQERNPLDFKTLFVHPSTDYDILIHLDTASNPKSYQSISYTPGYRNLDRSTATVRPGYDPAYSFCQDLQIAFADTLTFFYDVLGGSTIGAIVDPRLSEGKEFNFKILGGLNCRPGSGEKVATLNEDAVLKEIERMGEGLVKSIERRT